ncbi:hypothetical protein BY996DRAFT_6501605 [Phakopsora pachyrhizi]|nr:hypothetical protein BY996DRAFT_6501605 [Phakopsora pachyrhizi]
MPVGTQSQSHARRDLTSPPPICTPALNLETEALYSLPPPGLGSQGNQPKGGVDYDWYVKSEDGNEFYHVQGDQTIKTKFGSSQGRDDQTLTTSRKAPDSFDGINPSKSPTFLDQYGFSPWDQLGHPWAQPAYQQGKSY